MSREQAETIGVRSDGSIRVGERMTVKAQLSSTSLGRNRDSHAHREEREEVEVLEASVVNLVSTVDRLRHQEGGVLDDLTWSAKVQSTRGEHRCETYPGHHLQTLGIVRFASGVETPHRTTGSYESGRPTQEYPPARNDRSTG